MQHLLRLLEYPGAITGLCCHFIVLFLPLWQSRDGAGGRKPPLRGSPWDAASLAASSGRNAPPCSSCGAGELPLPTSSCVFSLLLLHLPWKCHSKRFAKRIRASPEASRAAPASLSPRTTFPWQTSSLR